MVASEVIAHHSENVFINCPFDNVFKEKLLKPLLFAVIYCGFSPLIASLRVDSRENRLQKIIEMIRSSTMSIHDLSRNTANKKGESFRFNMPFELGIDWAFSEFQQPKKFLILENEPYSVQRALSDLSGCDNEAHHNSPEEIICVARNWFAANCPERELPSGTFIWRQYHAFRADLYKKPGFKKSDISGLPMSEIIHKMQDWIQRRNELT